MGRKISRGEVEKCFVGMGATGAECGSCNAEEVQLRAEYRTELGRVLGGQGGHFHFLPTTQPIEAQFVALPRLRDL
jgi:hypothetical protein